MALRYRHKKSTLGVTPCQALGPLGEAVPDPQREQRVHVAPEVVGDGAAARLGQVEGRHGQHEAVQVALLSRA
jgi:hypothetical protein